MKSPTIVKPDVFLSACILIGGLAWLTDSPWPLIVGGWVLFVVALF